MELLAPAGNIERLHAAIDAGADAVYLGLDAFNARRNADNFSLDTFEEVCDWVHLRNASVYVTLNIEILPTEIDNALSYAQKAYRAGADAFIIQDIGLAHLLHTHLPQARLHASTQMNIHNTYGVLAAAELGFKRITFARELTLKEITTLTDLAAAYGMETECFGHGAQCICYSGQCLMSSMVGGRSANRGLCSQPCRLPYELHSSSPDKRIATEGSYLLSPRDLCTLPILDKVIETGVASLKIEGRMKSAKYVHEVTSVYRETIDAITNNAHTQYDNPSAEEKDGGAPWYLDKTTWDSFNMRLEEAFSRGFTQGHITRTPNNAQMSYKRPNNRGLFIGRISELKDKTARISSNVDLHKGDILEIYTNKGNFTTTLDASCSKDRSITIKLDKKAHKGDRVFRVKNAALEFIDDPFSPRIPITGTIILHKGEKAALFVSCINEKGHKMQEVSAYGDIVEAARTKSLTKEDVYKHINRLGQTNFVLKNLEIDLDEGVGMGFSTLHRLRNEALTLLERSALEKWKCRKNDTKTDAIIGNARYGVTSAPHQKASNQREYELNVVVTNIKHARLARKKGASTLYIPLLNYQRGTGQAAGVIIDDVIQGGYPKKGILMYPAIDHEEPLTPDALSLEKYWHEACAGKTIFVDDMGSLFKGLEMGAEVEAGPHIPVTNKATVDYFEQLGVKRIWLSPELSLSQIDALCTSTNLDLGVYVAGSQELMMSRHCFLSRSHECSRQCAQCPHRRRAHHLVDRMNYSFPIITDCNGVSHLYNGIEYDAITAIGDLLDMGIRSFMIDTTLMDEKGVQGSIDRFKKALDSSNSFDVKKRPHTTTGHLYRGVQ